MTATLHLSEYDESLVVINPINMFVFYPGGLDGNQLKQSFCEAIKTFTIFSSRIYRDNDHYYMLYDDNAATITERFYDQDFDDEHSGAHELAEYIDVIEIGLGKQTTKATIAHFNNGSLLALSISHALMDGVALGYFIYAWSGLTLGNQLLQPSQQRSFNLSNPHNTRHLDKGIDLPEEQLKELSLTQKNRHYKNIKYPINHVNELYARESISEDNRSDFVAFTTDLICSYAHKMIRDDQHFTLHIPVSARGIHKKLDLTYMGNAYIFASISLSKNQLNAKNFKVIYQEIFNTVANVKTEEYVNSHLTLNEDGTLTRFSNGSETFKRIDRTTAIISTSGTRKMVGGLTIGDFGTGNASMAQVSLSVPNGFIILPLNKDYVTVQVSSLYPLD